MKQLAVLILLLAGCAATTPAPAPAPAAPARVLAEIERIEKLVAGDPSNTPYMYILGTAEQPSFFNDMTLMQDGTAFITDTGRNEVVRLAPGADSFETIATDLIAPNGIETSADEQKLYVADFRGLNEIVLATNARRVLETSTPLNGIHGLVEHRGTLIGIQNVLGRARVVRVYLDEANRVELLESANPLLNNPATGVVAGDSYYFLASKGQKDVDQVVLRIPL